MCASALQQAQVRKVYFAATDPKTGAVVSTDHFFDRPGLNHRVEYKGGLLAQEASSMLKAFFRARRERNKKLNQELGGRKARRDLMNREGALHKAKLLSRKTILPSLAEGPDTDPRDPLP